MKINQETCQTRFQDLNFYKGFVCKGDTAYLNISKRARTMVSQLAGRQQIENRMTDDSIAIKHANRKRMIDFMEKYP